MKGKVLSFVFAWCGWFGDATLQLDECRGVPGEKIFNHMKNLIDKLLGYFISFFNYVPHPLRMHLAKIEASLLC
jgi:hypothetical protein